MCEAGTDTARGPIFIQLPLEERPRSWYNVLPDLPEPLPPPKDPEKGQPRLKRLEEVLLRNARKQETSQERWIPIPDGILDLYEQAGRPRPLFRARRLEEQLGTPARLYYKAEFYSPTGSHKVNTALAQAWYAREEGYERVATETGAGQWGTAVAYASALVGLQAVVYWVRNVYEWKTGRRGFMKTYGADVVASPSRRTSVGSDILAKNPEHPGSLGIAVSEGLENAQADPDTIYCLGSVLNHVLLHQTVIGLETKAQLERVDERPDVMISCLGGGSNFGGFVLPFVPEALDGGGIRFLATQSEAAPNLQGEYRYDYADHAELTPMLKMYTLGHRTEMRPIMGDGLRYHGAAPIVSLLRSKGLIDTLAYPADEKHVFQRAQTFIAAEGFLPAPESAYSVAGAIGEALTCKETGEEKVIVFNVSGHGLLDIKAYREKLGI
ncbi:MAG: TrpB-like pyridoxal phosphate-dependent enzyme [Thermoplasmata archaeon]